MLTKEEAKLVKEAARIYGDACALAATAEARTGSAHPWLIGAKSQAERALDDTLALVTEYSAQGSR